MNKFQKEVMKKVKHDLITPFPFGFNGIDVSYYYVRKNSRISVKMYNKLKK